MNRQARIILIIIALMVLAPVLFRFLPVIILAGLAYYVFFRQKYPPEMIIDKAKAWWQKAGLTDSKDKIIDYDTTHKPFTNPLTHMAWRPSPKLVLFVVLGLAVLFIIVDGLVSVTPGHVGIIYDRGRGVLAEELPEGLHLKIPFWQVAYKTDVRTQEYTMSSALGEGAIYIDDSMTAPTSDGQTVTIDATVLFHVDQNNAAELFQSVGPDFVQKIIRPSSRSQIRMVISEYTAIDIYSAKRAEAEAKMATELTEIFKDKNIVLERVLLRNVMFSDEYAAAIEQKQVAQQRIQQAEYQRQEAEKLKEKTIIEAQAEAEAIKLKGETLRANPQVIQFEFVQKMAPNISWGIMPDGAVPFLNLQGFGGQ